MADELDRARRECLDSHVRAMELMLQAQTPAQWPKREIDVAIEKAKALAVPLARLTDSPDLPLRVKAEAQTEMGLCMERSVELVEAIKIHSDRILAKAPGAKR